MRQTESSSAFSAALRLRRSLFGYRRADVLDALEKMHTQLDAMAGSLNRIWEEKEEAKREVLTVRSMLEQELAEERARGERIEADARARAARILAQAEEEATRIRHDAGLRIGDAASRLEDLLRVREHLLGELRGIVHAYSDVLEQAEHHLLPPLAAEPSAPAAPRPAEELVSVLSPGRAGDGGGLYPRHVELDAGPFADFSELSAFERSLARLPKVEDVHIRHFGEERAEIELTLAEETPLVHDLNRHLPFAVDVKAADESHLHVDVAVEAVTGTGA